MPVAPTARASVDVGTVRQRFNYDWAIEDPNDLGTYWWWCISIRVDPNEVIADDDEGNLWSIPFTTDGEDGVTFGDPTQVRQTYVPVTGDGAAATAMVARRGQRVLAAALERPDKPDPKDNNPARASVEPPPEGAPMDEPVRQFLERQGIDPDTATEAQITSAEAFASLPINQPAAPPAGDPDPAPAADPEPAVPADTEPVLVAASANAVTVDRDTWERTQRDAAAGAAARTQQLATDLDATVAAAVKDGRITPASRDAWRASIDPGTNPTPEATARATAEASVLAGLEKNRVPVTELGKTPNAEAAEGDPALLAAVRARVGIPTTQKAA